MKYREFETDIIKIEPIEWNNENCHKITLKMSKYIDDSGVNLVNDNNIEDLIKEICSVKFVEFCSRVELYSVTFITKYIENGFNILYENFKNLNPHIELNHVFKDDFLGQVEFDLKSNLYKKIENFFKS